MSSPCLAQNRPNLSENSSVFLQLLLLFTRELGLAPIIPSPILFPHIVSSDPVALAIKVSNTPT